MTDETTWLDEAEQAAWRAYLRGGHALEVRLDADLQKAGLSLAEYEIISMLSEAEGQALRMSQLADIVVQSRSRVTHTATRLAKRGWVERRAAAGDGRGVELVLTPQGQEALSAVAALHVRGVREHLIDQMSREEFLTMGNSMRQVCDHLGVAGLPDPAALH